MSQDFDQFDELRDAALNRRIGRRTVLKRAALIGISAPAIAALLAACGDEEDNPTATTGAGATATTGGGDGTPTMAAETTPTGEAMATGTSEGEPSATGEAEPSATGEAEPTAGGTPTGDAGDRTMGRTIEPAGNEGGTLVEATFSDISTTNPVMIADSPSSDFLSLIFDALVQPNPDTLEPVGFLTTGWEVSDDGLTWTLALREGVSWHDGEMFTADDVKITYDLHMNPDTGSSYTADIGGKIASVDVVDDYTVSFVLNAPVSDFLVDLAIYGIVAEHVWAEVAAADVAADGGSTGQDPARVVGTGPFIFEEWLVEQQASATRNDNYWDGPVYLDRFVYLVVADQAAGVQQLLAGDVDWMLGVPESSANQLEGTDVSAVVYPTINFTFYGTNLDETKTTLFQDANVRKGLLYALDREAMIETIRAGYGQVAVGTMPTISWAYNPDGIEERYEYDVEMAQQLLDEAGWTLGDDGVRQLDGQRLAFSMYTNAGNLIREAYLTAMQEFWAQIGVEMTPVLEPFPALVERITETFDFEAVLIGFTWSASPDQSAMWACDSYGGGFNFVKYCNEEVDALMAEAIAEPDRETRIEMYTQMQNLILADLPMAVLDFPEEISGVNNRVHNLFPNSVNARFNANTWWIEA